MDMFRNLVEVRANTVPKYAKFFLRMLDLLQNDYTGITSIYYKKHGSNFIYTIKSTLLDPDKIIEILATTSLFKKMLPIVKISKFISPHTNYVFIEVDINQLQTFKPVQGN